MFAWFEFPVGTIVASFFIILEWILGGILDTLGHPWDTMWSHGRRRGPYLRVILVTVLNDIFRDPIGGTIQAKWTRKVSGV